MTSRNRNMTPWIVALIGLLSAAGAPAVAQSDSALRRENDALRAQVNDLEAELKAARQRIKELQATVARLEATIERMESGGNGRTDTPPEPEQVSIDESEPDASPRALLNALQEDYQQALADMETGAANSRQRNVYLRAVERWVRAVNRKYRGQIQWHVTVQDVAAGPRGSAGLTLVAVDPKYGTQLGDPFPAVVENRTLVRRLDRMVQNNELIGRTMVVRGVLEPNLRVNPNRETQGTFNNPPFIGPFAEFAMRIDVTALLTPEAVADEQNQ